MQQVTRMLVLAGVAMGLWCHAEAPDPESLVKSVIAALEGADSLRVEGKTYSSIVMGEGSPTMEMGGAFTIMLGRPVLYRIAWEQTMAGMELNKGVVWNDGEGPRMYMSANNAWYPHESDMMALSAATGVSGGAAHTLPGVFLGLEDMQSTLSMLRDFAYAGEEDVRGTACHKVTAKSMVSQEHMLWIEQERPVLRKLQYALGSSDPGVLSEEKIDEALEAMGEEVNDSTREMMRGMMEMQRQMMANVSGHVGEEYTVFEIDAELPETAFAFAAPEGAIEYSSMWEGMAGGGGGAAEGESTYNTKFSVGDTAPDFEGKTLDGSTIRLADYRGKVVLLDFWATWCGPCIAVLPGLIDAYGEYHEDGFEIIGISLDDDGEALERFVEQREGMDWPNLLDGQGVTSSIGQEYGVEAIPHTLLLDGEGVIRYRGVHGARLKEAIAELLAEQEG